MGEVTTWMAKVTTKVSAGLLAKTSCVVLAAAAWHRWRDVG